MRSLVGALRGHGGRPQNAAAPSRSLFGLGGVVAAEGGVAPSQRLLHTPYQVSTLFAIVNRLANSTASVRWQLWRKAASGEEKDRTRVTRHAALDLWNRPNKFYTRMRSVETFQQHLDLTGECAWLLIKGGRLPVEYWPVRPDRLHPVPNPKGYGLLGYLYVAASSPELVPLGVDDVIRPMMPSPLDAYRGLGPVQALLTNLDATRYSAEWNRKFFENSAEPGGIIEVTRSLDDDEWDQFRRRWTEQHRGVSNAHRVAMLEEGQKWVDRTYTNRDMQFAELNGIGREIIREAFGFPKSMLGAVEDVNRANAEAGEVVFGRWLIVPRLERIKDAVNNELLPMFYPPGAEVPVEFDYVPPVPEDRQADNEALLAQSTAFRTLVEAGVHPEDAAALVGMPPVRMAPRPQPQPGGRPAPGNEQDDEPEETA